MASNLLEIMSWLAGRFKARFGPDEAAERQREVEDINEMTIYPRSEQNREVPGSQT
jgi:hypothetical protein